MTQPATATSLIIAHPRERRFLLIPAAQGWALPQFAAAPTAETAVGPLRQAARSELALSVAVGRQLSRHDDPAGRIYEAFLDSDAEGLPSGARWGGAADLPLLEQEPVRPLLTAWLAEEQTPSLRAPWFRPGWHAKAKGWIAAAVDRAGLQLTGPCEQVKASDWCSILRVPTSGADLYFKAAGRGTRYEAALTRFLDSAYPGRSVPVVEAEPTEGWLLMRDLGGEALRTRKEKDLWQRALGEFAALQVEQSHQVQELLALGVPDRRLPVLRAQIEAHLPAMCATGLTEQETTLVLALQPELLRMCDQLEALSIPASLEHGDLHSANIRQVGDNLLFFDWGDATVAHPFFSTRIFWHALDDLIASEEEWLAMVDQFRPHYLAAWRQFAPMEELEAALQISDQLACVHRALSYHLYLTPSFEDQAPTQKRPAQWLQVLLDHRQLLRAAGRL